jgi:hypothetical protein
VYTHTPTHVHVCMPLPPPPLLVPERQNLRQGALHGWPCAFFFLSLIGSPTHTHIHTLTHTHTTHSHTSGGDAAGAGRADSTTTGCTGRSRAPGVLVVGNRVFVGFRFRLHRLNPPCQVCEEHFFYFFIFL